MSDDRTLDLDLDAVAADEAALEALRTAAVDDPALVLLRELLLDVERDLPAPVGHGSSVMALAGGGPERRLARNGTVVAAFTAGLLTLGGVAAASTLAPVDSPLHGLGQAVRSAAGAVVGAVTPPASPGRSGAVLSTAKGSPSAAAEGASVPRTPTPGATVSAAVRSRAAARQVDRLLDDASALLTAGRTAVAVTRLDLAERRLTEVLATDRADLPERLADLRAKATAALTATPARPPMPPPAKAETRSEEQRSEEQRSAEQRPAEQRSEPRGSARTTPPQSGRTDAEPPVGQLSRDASMKPRA